MERWLIISNCHTFGLVNSFTLMNPRLDVDGVDYWTYRGNVDHYNARMETYSRVIIEPAVVHIPGFDSSSAINIDKIPTVHFDGYHPDMCYARANGNRISGAMDDYGSTIAVAAFNSGLNLSQAKKLYCGKTYEIAGYLSGWDAKRDLLIKDFGDFGLDISSAFQRWSRGKSFMYSFNHSKISVLYDIAKSFMNHQGVDVLESDFLPADNLAAGPCFPIYNEIAENLSLRGSYLFKDATSYRFDTLEQFLERSYGLYAATGAPIQVEPPFQPRYEKILCLIRGEI